MPDGRLRCTASANAVVTDHLEEVTVRTRLKRLTVEVVKRELAQAGNALTLQPFNPSTNP